MPPHPVDLAAVDMLCQPAQSLTHCPKRPRSNLDSEPALASAAPPPKRSKPLYLTRKALSTIPKVQPGGATSVDLWAKSCSPNEEMEPTQQHPRLRAQIVRRAAARSRSSSPAKKPPYSATAEYRSVTMQLARVFVERELELPVNVAASVERILGIRTATHVSGHNDEEDATAREATTLAETYRAQSKLLAKDCAGEVEWRIEIRSILSSLSKRWSPVLRVLTAEKTWSQYLKPPVFELRVRGASPGPTLLPLTNTSLPNDPNAFGASFAIDSSPSSAHTFQLSTPKPNITVGLESTWISQALNLDQDILLHLQTGIDSKQPFLSDPHQVPLGLRFPFLVVEAKGLNTGSNLLHAQNQAAVAAASALNILSELDELASDPGVDFDANAEISMPNIIFSLTTEGPTHELWVHYRTEDNYHMSCLQSWRTTLPGHSEELIQYLARVMEWGAGDFKDSVLTQVQRLWRNMCEQSESM